MTEEQLHTKIQEYLKIFAGLMFLTLITFAMPVFISLDIYNLFVVQFLIASSKAFFILAFYMHLKTSSSLIKIVVVCAGAVLLTFFVLVGIDSNVDDSPRDLFQSTVQH